MSTLTERIAVVTRADSATGTAARAALEHAGARVIAGDIDAAELVRRAVAAHGRLDILVNVAIVTPLAPVETTPVGAFRDAMSANLDAMFFACQAAARQMSAQAPPGGVIINVTSVAGVVAIAGHAALGAAAAGMNAVTKVLATEWGAMGIRVVGVGAGVGAELVETLAPPLPLPGATTASHRRVPARLTDAAAIARTVVWLAGDDAAHINGTTVVADHGWLADGYWE